MVGLKYTIKRKYVNTQTLAKSEFSKTVTTLRIKDTSGSKSTTLDFERPQDKTQKSS